MFKLCHYEPIQRFRFPSWGFYKTHFMCQPHGCNNYDKMSHFQQSHRVRFNIYQNIFHCVSSMGRCVTISKIDCIIKIQCCFGLIKKMKISFGHRIVFIWRQNIFEFKVVYYNNFDAAFSRMKFVFVDFFDGAVNALLVSTQYVFAGDKKAVTTLAIHLIIWCILKTTAHKISYFEIYFQ